MLRWITASVAMAAATILLSPSKGSAQVSADIDGPAPASSAAPSTPVPIAAPEAPTPFTGPATNTRPRLRPTYASSYAAPFSSYMPRSAWADRPADLIKPVQGFNAPVRARIFNGYPPSYYAGFVTTGLPTYLTSINYPTVYGAYQYNGVMWPGGGGGMATVSVKPWTSYPSTYNPVAPPTEVAFSHFSPGYQVPPGSGGVGGMANLTAAGPATIDIRVPSYADVWIQGTKMARTGEVRHFVSPTLSPHQRYSYDITARWLGKDNNWRVVTNSVSCSRLLDSAGGEGVPGNSPRIDERGKAQR
jgi:uncharacterized protein (TIGR03000 family)